MAGRAKEADVQEAAREGWAVSRARARRAPQGGAGWHEADAAARVGFNCNMAVMNDEMAVKLPSATALDHRGSRLGLVLDCGCGVGSDREGRRRLQSHRCSSPLRRSALRCSQAGLMHTIMVLPPQAPHTRGREEVNVSTITRGRKHLRKKKGGREGE